MPCEECSDDGLLGRPRTSDFSRCDYRAAQMKRAAYGMLTNAFWHISLTVQLLSCVDLYHLLDKSNQCFKDT
jgi:hypothetical protein